MVHTDHWNQSEDLGFGLKPNQYSRLANLYFLFTSNKTLCLQLFFWYAEHPRIAD